MKNLIVASALMVLLFSCKKSITPVQTGSSSYLRTVIAQLKDSLSGSDFQALDTGTVFLSKPTTSKDCYLRLAFTGRSIAEDFVLVTTDEAGNIRRGTLVHLDNKTQSGSNQFSGAIDLRSFSRKLLIQSSISNGYIDKQRYPNQPVISSSNTKTVTMLPAPDADWLDPAVVVGYPAGPSGGPYISLDGLMGMTGSGGIGAGSGGSQGSGGSNPGGGGGGAGGGSGHASAPPPVPAPAPPPAPKPIINGRYYGPLIPGGGTTNPVDLNGVVKSNSIELEADYSNNIPVIDIRKFFNCFDLVPSAGATYTIQLCADLPVNSLPDASMNFSGRVNAGHTFLIVTKSGSGMSVTQSFGFYPNSAPSAWDPFSPLPSAMKDNEGQEINSSIIMSITADQFATVKATAINLSEQSYTLDKFNCTDYALGVFNVARTTPLSMEPYVMTQAGIVLSNGMSSPSITVTIINSPQMLFKKLQTLKNDGGPEATNIQLDLSHDLRAPASHGQCN